MKQLRNLIRLIIIGFRHFIYRVLYGMDIDRSARVSFGAKLDKTYPQGIHIGKESYVASGAIIFAHDFSRGLHKDTVIGKRCFVGANAIIMCGVHVGDEVIVGGGGQSLLKMSHQIVSWLAIRQGLSRSILIRQNMDN